MNLPQVKYLGKAGVLPEHAHLSFEQAPMYGTRLTVPAKETLLAAGAKVRLQNFDRYEIYMVQLLEKCPESLVAVNVQAILGYPYSGSIGIRRVDELEYPHEYGIDFWRCVNLTPCPECGSSLIWYEAGYVSGYRVCSSKEHHHVLVL